MAVFLNIIFRTVGLVPLIICHIAVKYHIDWLIPIAIVSVFVIVGTTPFYNHRENFAVFVQVLITLIPFNIQLLQTEFIIILLEDLHIIHRSLFICLIYSFFFSVEELSLGLVSRLIWPKQGKSIFHLL